MCFIDYPQFLEPDACVINAWGVKRYLLDPVDSQKLFEAVEGIFNPNKQ